MADKELVTIKIDGKEVSVPKGTNVIEAAKKLGIDIPHYCYHPNLSIAGNCRMCQVEIKGAPKLEIACNCMARDGLEISTHHTSKAVEDAQAATLEFLLINHPLDCTVCDQAGHCKLQDYHYEYNARSSRFLEDKVHKVKAEPLGPHVILDGERCIACTRCIRFCDEVTETSELGMLNRGDRSVIAINKGRELNNPLSGTVVDLCPVGALTHRDWRFNTRMWFTEQTDSICPGCSTGCNVKVAVRDRQIVQVKARPNQMVNKEWLCDEGRYGFHRFLPPERLISAMVEGRPVEEGAAYKQVKNLASSNALIFVSPDLLLEEYALIKTLANSILKNSRVVISYKKRPLTPVEAKLISPDYAANFQGAVFAGLVSGNLEEDYKAALQSLINGVYKSVLFIGDRAISKEDQTPQVLHALQSVPTSVGLFCDEISGLTTSTKVVFPARSILEKSGLLINSAERLQYSARVIDFPDGSKPDWQIISRIGLELGSKLSSAIVDRELTIEYLTKERRLAGLTIAKIKQGGICLKSSATAVEPRTESTGAPL